MRWRAQARSSFAATDDFSWLGADWGARGGPAARELALWVQLQREFRRRHLLPAEAIRRLDAVGFNWDPQVWRATRQLGVRTGYGPRLDGEMQEGCNL